jgi:hypothetical protein
MVIKASAMSPMMMTSALIGPRPVTASTAIPARANPIANCFT